MLKYIKNIVATARSIVARIKQSISNAFIAVRSIFINIFKSTTYKPTAADNKTEQTRAVDSAAITPKASLQHEPETAQAPETRNGNESTVLIVIKQPNPKQLSRAASVVSTLRRPLITLEVSASIIQRMFAALFRPKLMLRDPALSILTALTALENYAKAANAPVYSGRLNNITAPVSEATAENSLAIVKYKPTLVAKADVNTESKESKELPKAKPVDADVAALDNTTVVVKRQKLLNTSTRAGKPGFTAPPRRRNPPKVTGSQTATYTQNASGRRGAVAPPRRANRAAVAMTPAAQVFTTNSFGAISDSNDIDNLRERMKIIEAGLIKLEVRFIGQEFKDDPYKLEYATNALFIKEIISQLQVRFVGVERRVSKSTYIEIPEHALKPQALTHDIDSLISAVTVLEGRLDALKSAQARIEHNLSETQRVSFSTTDPRGLVEDRNKNGNRTLRACL